MNNLLKQSLILGALFEVISYMVDLVNLFVLDIMLFIVFIYLFIRLIRLKELKFINKIVDDYHKISIYMKCLGWTWY